MFFNIVNDLFKSIEVLRRSGNIQIGSTAERIIVLVGLGNKYLNTLSNFALKILSIHSLTKSVF